MSGSPVNFVKTKLADLSPVKHTKMPSFGGKRCNLFCDFLISSLSGGVSSDEALPNRLLHSRYGRDETLPLEAACATETAAHKTAPLFFPRRRRFFVRPSMRGW